MVINYTVWRLPVHGLSVVGSHVCYVDRVLVALAVIDNVAAPMVCRASHLHA